MSLVTLIAGAWGLVALTPLLTRVLGRQVGWAIGAGLLGLAGAAIAFRASAGDLRESVPWIPAIDVALRLRLDGLAFLFTMIVLVVGAVVMVYSSSYVRHERPTGFYVLMSAFAAAMLTLVLADDLVLMFVAWELTTLCSYLLIARSGPTAGPPAGRTLLMTAAGGLCLLGAVAAIVVRTGTTEVTAALVDPAWEQDPAFATTVAILVALAAMTKSAQFPFHSWLPDAMVAPAPVSAYLHAAAMVKAGIYLLMLFAPATSHAAVWSVLLIVVGIVTSVMGSLFALARTDLKGLLAYSTVSQLGLLVAVIGIGTPAAMVAASIHVVAHALFKSAGFMSVGLLERRAGTRDIRELRGLARAMPWDASMMALAAMSMAGVLPMLGFVSKELALETFLGHPAGASVGWMLAITVTAGAVLTVAYSLRIVVGPLPGEPMSVRPWGETWPMTLAISTVALTGLLLGPASYWLDATIGAAAGAAAGTAQVDVHLALWHGFNSPLLLSVVALAGGAALIASWRRVGGFLVGRELLPVRGVDLVQEAYDGVIALGRRVGDLTRTDRPALHLAVPITLIGASVVALATLWHGWPAESNVDAIDLPLMVIVAVGSTGVLRARGPLAAIISIGVVGFGVVLWFFLLGASDVALTQLLVEILTVVVMVMVLRRMAPRFSLPGGLSRILPAIAAVAAGAAATMATLVFTGHRPMSAAGEFFLLRAQELTGGTNVVNTILVDFRALDTLGELVVLAICAVSVSALLEARPAVDASPSPPPEAPLADPIRNAVHLRITDRLLVPIMLVGSGYALLRGHNAPGGGFIAALIGAAALALAYLSAPSDVVRRVERPYLTIAGAGMLVAVGTGLLGFVEESFLRPIHVDLLGVHLTTALLFDVGVYLAVLGVILAAINLLGLSSRTRASTPGLPSSRKRARREAGAR